MRRLPPLPAIRAFEAAARLGSYARAAEELGLTPGGVSHQIRLIEERVGVALFAKVGRGVALTTAGARVAPLVTSAFDDLDGAFAALRSESETVLTIGASRTFAANWLAVRLGAFQVQRPNLAVRVHTSDEIVDLEHGEVDVAVRSSARPWPGLVSHFLMRQAFTPLASPAYLDTWPVNFPADVLNYTRLSPDDEWWQQWLSAAGVTDVPARARGGVRLDSQVMEGNAAMAGHGIAILNPCLWQAQIRTRALVRPLRHIGFDPSSFWLVYPEHRRNLPKVRALRDWLLAEIAADALGDTEGLYAPPE